MMLNNYQKLQQLKILRNTLISEYDMPKKEALDFAIKAVEKEINQSEPCFFDDKFKCKILIERNCHNCSFRRTKEEWEKDQKRAKKRLEQLGLTVQKVKEGNREIFKSATLTKENKA